MRITRCRVNECYDFLTYICNGMLHILLCYALSRCVVLGYSVLFMSAYQMCHLRLKLPRPCMPVVHSHNIMF